MSVSDSTPDQDPMTAGHYPPPIPSAPLGYSKSAYIPFPLALRVVCWAAIIVGLCQAVTISNTLLRFGMSGLINSIPSSLTLIIREAIGIGMVVGGILALTGTGGVYRRQILIYSAWVSLVWSAYLLISITGFELSRLPSSRPVWSIGITLLNDAHTYFNAAVLPLMILVLTRGKDSQPFMEYRA